MPASSSGRRGPSLHWGIWGTWPPYGRKGGARPPTRSEKIEKLREKWRKKREKSKKSALRAVFSFKFASKSSKFRKILQFYLYVSKKWRHVTSFWGSSDMKIKSFWIMPPPPYGKFTVRACPQVQRQTAALFLRWLPVTTNPFTTNPFFTNPFTTNSFHDEFRLPRIPSPRILLPRNLVY